MLKLFRLILGRNIRSILTLFFVLFLASTGFLVMRQLTENIEGAVSRETQPLFGGDIRVSPRDYSPIPVIDVIAPYLSGAAYTWGEKTEFSTTLFDREGKTGLVNVIAYAGEYPQKGILELSPERAGKNDYIAATEGLVSRFASGGILTVDGRDLTLTHTIINSSDLGFSFGSDNHLLFVPVGALSGSMLISSGSRLDQDLLLSFSPETDIRALSENLKKIPALAGFRIQNYTDRSESTFDTVEELTDYILLILVVAAIFAGIILRSSHDALFADLARTLRIVETLGFSRKRRALLFLLLYSIIIPLSFVASLGASYLIIELIASVPEASEFAFLVGPIWFTVQVLALLILVAFAPPWIDMVRTSRGYESTLLSRLMLPRFRVPSSFVRPLRSLFDRLSLREAFPLILGIFGIVWIIFSDVLWSMLITLASVTLFLIFALLVSMLYGYLFQKLSFLREKYFAFFDGIRTLVRPITPTIPITISLLGITSFFVVFLLFSFSFREKLLIDSGNTANIYAINVLESDRENVEKVLTGGSIYSIMRARISSINGKTLAEHLETPNPSGEFTREFNVTSDETSARVIRGKETLAPDEVSVDDEFAQRLGVTIGDEIEFLLSGRKFALTVASIRESKREGFSPFFYFTFEKEAFRNAPKTYFVTAYTPDTESWKKMILAESGPHVTFIDIENILSIARDIANKILAVISLFFVAIGLFGVMAIFSLFGRLRPIEQLKSKLYALFGASHHEMGSIFRTTRGALFLVAFVLSQGIGVGIFLAIVSGSPFLTFSFVHFLWTLGIIGGLYLILYALVGGIGVRNSK